MLTPEQITYSVFGLVLVAALALDLGLLSKKNTTITIRKALLQTFFWVSLALAFFLFVWIEEGQTVALEYLSAYFMEWKIGRAHV